MIRKLKALGLACMAVLALGALVASAAQASGGGTLTTFPAGTTVKVTGVQENGVHKFILTDHPVVIEEKAGFATTECTTAHFHGVGTYTTGATTATVEPTYSGCKSFGLNSTITTNGCHFSLTLTNTVAAKTGWDVDTNVVCPAGKVITIVAATCEVQVGTQSGLTTIEATNAGSASPETAMDITLHQNVTGIKYTVTKDGIGCPLSGTGSFSKGDYTGNTTVTATHSVSGLPAGITIH